MTSPTAARPLSQRAAERADDYVPGHGDLRFDVLSYALTLRYGVEDNRLAGRATLRCRVAKDTDRLVLDLHRLSVTKVTVDGARPAKFTHRSGRLEIRLQRPATVGDELTVAIAYGGHPAPVGGPLGDAGWEELADGVIVAAQPHGAPSWFPCNDRPSDKASYVVELTAPTAYHVLCNGVARRAASRREHDDLAVRAVRADGDVPRDRADRPLHRATTGRRAGAHRDRASRTRSATAPTDRSPARAR